MGVPRLLLRSTHGGFLLALLVGTLLLFHGELTFQDRLSSDLAFAVEGRALTGGEGGIADGHSGVADYLATLLLISGPIFWLFLIGRRKLRGTIIAFHLAERCYLATDPLYRRGPTASFLQVFRL